MAPPRRLLRISARQIGWNQWEKNSLIFSERVGFVVWRRFRDHMWFPVWGVETATLPNSKIHRIKFHRREAAWKKKKSIKQRDNPLIMLNIRHIFTPRIIIIQAINLKGLICFPLNILLMLHCFRKRRKDTQAPKSWEVVFSPIPQRYKTLISP